MSKWVLCFLQEVKQKIHTFKNIITHHFPVLAELVEPSNAKSFFPLPIHLFSYHPLILQNTFKTEAHIQWKISASTQINNYKHFIYRSGEKKKSKLKLSDFAILWVILPIQAFVVAVVYNSSKTRVLHKIRWRNVLIYKAAL